MSDKITGNCPNCNAELDFGEAFVHYYRGCKQDNRIMERDLNE